MSVSDPLRTFALLLGLLNGGPFRRYGLPPLIVLEYHLRRPPRADAVVKSPEVLPPCVAALWLIDAEINFAEVLHALHKNVRPRLLAEANLEPREAFVGPHLASY